MQLRRLSAKEAQAVLPMGAEAGMAAMEAMEEKSFFPGDLLGGHAASLPYDNGSREYTGCA